MLLHLISSQANPSSLGDEAHVAKVLPVAKEAPGKAEITQEQKFSRRKSARLPFPRTVDWDFFSSATGAKSGYIENVSQGGCLLRTNEPVESRRWIRMMVKEEKRNLWFTAVGRVIHRQDKIEPWGRDDITLYRYGVEFIQPINSMVLSQISQSQTFCAVCGNASASISDASLPDKMYCVLCHLRKACHNLLVDQEQGTEPEPA